MLQVEVLPLPFGSLSPTALRVAGGLAAAVQVSFDITPATSVTELLRNACVNCGLFPIVAQAGRLVNVAAFLEVGSGRFKGHCAWINVDLTSDPDVTVFKQLGLISVVPALCTTPAGFVIELRLVHATTFAAAKRLFQTFAKDNEDNGVQLIRAGFQESGLLE